MSQTLPHTLHRVCLRALAPLLIMAAGVLAGNIFSSCTKDPGDGPEDATTGFPAIRSAYYSGEYFQSAKKTATGTTITFKSHKTIEVATEDLKISDCTILDRPFVTKNQTYNCWNVDGYKTEVPLDLEIADKEAIPVCAYYDSVSVGVYLNNGTLMKIGNSPESCLESFKFLAGKNQELIEGMVCTIDGNNVTGTFSSSLDSYLLRPTFTYRGKSISVEGKSQISEQTSQDFILPVIYTIDLYDGSTISFTVNLKRIVDIPVVYIQTDNNAKITSTETYVSGTIAFKDHDRIYSLDSLIQGRMQIRGRGNTSWTMMPKKSWKIKLDQKTSVFGMNGDKDWVLLANYSDKTLLRNITSMEISRICGMSWTPKMISVEVYLNSQYQGCYTFAEHKEVDKKKVNIDVVAPTVTSGEELTGGYYLEMEQAMDEICCFYTTMGVPMMFKDPEKPNQQQQEYMTQYFKDFEKTLTSPYFLDTDIGYSAYIDVNSFVNYYIIKELTKDIDGNLRKSTFLTKEKGKKLEMYHVWDFDLALGNCNYFPDMYPGSSNAYSGWFIKDYSSQGYQTGWYYYLFKDPAFQHAVKVRWNEVKAQLATVPDFIDQNAALINAAQGRNFKTWRILNVYVWPNVFVTGTYQGELDYMKSFYTRRLNWLDTQINLFP